MNPKIIEWLASYGMPEHYLTYTGELTGISIILLLAYLGYLLVNYKVIALITRLISRSRNKTDDLLVEHKIFSRIARIVPAIMLLVLLPIVLLEQSTLTQLLTTAAKIIIVIQVARIISALMDVVQSIYQPKATTKYLPLNASIQVLKLLVYLVATILAIAYLLNKSPIYLLSGLGALTAVLLLIFQDTIKGLVASIQISANRMVAPGDWVELPQYGADGDVLEIGLNTVKIQNFDRTVTTVPTYALVSGSFKNWRDMFNAGGRRIKRAINVDVSSIRFYQQDEIETLKQIHLLKPYLEQKQQEIYTSLSQQGLDKEDKVNSRQLTNIGTFRAYIAAYLDNHPKVHSQMTCMVRQLAASPTGVPLELYLFTNDTNWANYEGIQADIFDHLYAMTTHFDLRVFQHPSGYDWRSHDTTNP